MYGLLGMGSGNADGLVCRTSVLQLLVSGNSDSIVGRSSVPEFWLHMVQLKDSIYFTWSNSRIQFASHGPTQGFNLLHMIQLKDSICFT
jgi:hypothetical protein